MSSSFLFSNPFGNLRLKTAHKHVELVCRFLMGKIGHPTGSSNQDVLHHRGLFIKGTVKLVLLRLCLTEWLYRISRIYMGSCTEQEQAKQAA